MFELCNESYLEIKGGQTSYILRFVQTGRFSSVTSGALKKNMKNMTFGALGLFLYFINEIPIIRRQPAPIPMHCN